MRRAAAGAQPAVSTLLGDAYFQFARNMVKGMSKNFPAPAKWCRRHRSRHQGQVRRWLAVERELFINLMWTPESRSLRHLFLAERAASRFPMCPQTPRPSAKSRAWP